MGAVGYLSDSERRRFAQILYSIIDRTYRHNEDLLDKYYALVDAWARGEAQTLSEEELSDLERLILKATGLD